MDKKSIKEFFNMQTDEKAKFLIKTYMIATEKYGGEPEDWFYGESNENTNENNKKNEIKNELFELNLLKLIM